MWKSIIVCLGLLVLLCSRFSNAEAQQIDLVDYLPDPAELQPWEAEEEPRSAEGETLFMLINGAAELYFEYGFQRGIFQSYALSDEQWIDVEIFEMTDAVAAYGLQSFKRGQSGKSLDIGQEAFLEDYYLNFRKGRVQVSVVGQDDSDATLEALMKIAKAIEVNIPEEGDIPELASLLVRSELAPLHAVHIKGQLGLFNKIALPPDVIVGFDEGVVGHYNGFTLALLKYPSKEAATSSFSDAANVLQQASEDKSKGEQSFSVEQFDGKILHLKAFQEYIIVVLGNELQQAEEFGEELKALLD